MISLIILVMFTFLLVKFILKYRSNFLFFYLLPLFQFIWKTVSLIYLESGKYNQELGRTTYRLYSDYIFLFYMILFFVLSIVFINIYMRRMTDCNNKIISNEKSIKYYRIIQYLHIVVVIYLYVNMYLTGAPHFIPSITRFNFFSLSRLPFIAQLSGAFSCFMLFIDGELYWNARKKSKLSLVLFFLMIYYQFLFGNKFSGFLQYTVFFLGPYILLITQKNGMRIKDIFNKKVVLIFIICVVALCFLLKNGFKYQLGLGQSFIELLEIRIFSLQSGPMWAICEYINNEKIALLGSGRQLELELQGVLSGAGEMDVDIGICKVMFLIAPLSRVTYYISHGIRFSGWYLTVSLLSIGYLGSFFLTILIAYIFAVLCVGFYIFIKENNVIMIGLALYAYWQFDDYFRIGNYNLLFNNVVMLILLLFMIRLSVIGNGKRIAIKVR